MVIGLKGTKKERDCFHAFGKGRKIEVILMSCTLKRTYLTMWSILLWTTKIKPRQCKREIGLDRVLSTVRIPFAKAC